MWEYFQPFIIAGLLSCIVTAVCMYPAYQERNELRDDHIQPVNKGVSRAYISDQWSYTHVITAPNSSSKGFWGILIWDGKVLGYQARVNDYYATPWGNMYWHGQTIRRLSGPHFFLPYEKENRAPGKELYPEDASEKLMPPTKTKRYQWSPLDLLTF